MNLDKFCAEYCKFYEAYMSEHKDGEIGDIPECENCPLEDDDDDYCDCCVYRMRCEDDWEDE